MKNRDFHDKSFDEPTLEKLKMFQEYVREWLPVFIQRPTVDRIQVFDFFAGPGCDTDQKQGSPLIICEEVRNALPPNRSNVTIPIRLYFNEMDQEKHALLCENLSEQRKNLPPHVSILTEQLPFADAFEKERQYMANKNVANLLFLDQFGISQITPSVFQRIVSLPRTDFLFFIASSTVNRFKGDKSIRDYVPVTDEDCRDMKSTNVHRILAGAYRRWIPDNIQRYYIAPFSLKKGANVYGLIFGSGHPLGMDKFLDLAWKHGGPGGAGEANFDIDGDRIQPDQPSLWSDMDVPTKIKEFERELEEAILDGTLRTNKDIYEYALERGMLPAHARDKFKDMVKNGQLPKQRIFISYDAWSEPTPVRILLKGGIHERCL